MKIQLKFIALTVVVLFVVDLAGGVTLFVVRVKAATYTFPKIFKLSCRAIREVCFSKSLVNSLIKA